MNTDIMPPAQAPTDVKQPPIESVPAGVSAQPVPEVHEKSQSVPAAPKASSGVGVAIAATVVIVLGLAALATYAYLQTR